MDCPGTALEATPTLGRFLFFQILTAVPVLAAPVAIVRHAEAACWPFVYVGLCLVHAGIIYAIQCPRCLHTDCPHNRVPEGVRDEYRKRAA